MGGDILPTRQSNQGVDKRAWAGCPGGVWIGAVKLIEDGRAVSCCGQFLFDSLCPRPEVFNQASCLSLPSGQVGQGDQVGVHLIQTGRVGKKEDHQAQFF